MLPSSDRELVDLIIIVPLEEELHVVMKVFPSKTDKSTPTSFRHLVDVGAANIRCLVVQQADMGRTAASQAANEILGCYETKLMVCLGMAGSLSKDMNLTDVCYTGNLMDVYDNSKVDDVSKRKMRLRFSPVHYQTPIEIATAFNFIRTQPELQDLYGQWCSVRSLSAERLLPQAIPGRQSKPYTVRAPKTMCGTIICGSVSKSESYNEALTDIDRKALAIETESGGIFIAATAAHVPVIIIRGIADYADANKAALEDATAGAVRALAVENAATFLKLQFQNRFFLSLLDTATRQNSLALTEAQGGSISTPASLVDLLESIGGDIEQHLRRLCPEYKLQSSGYRLPIPRARRRETSKSVDPKTRAPAYEIRGIIGTQKLVMLDLPRTYPDQALPWMIAHDLLTTEIAGGQAIPLVIDGARVAPPKSGLSRVSGYDLDGIASRPGTTPVVIIDNCPLASKTRMKYLFAEVERLPEARFVFIARGNGSLIFSSDIGVQFKVELFDICDISFAELTHFVERNFSLSFSEAEVIAYRLQGTFQRYELSAHPSYLAAIPNSTLSALINANRRSELIQLAVDGTLSFVVVDDPNDISLSRTTRSRFLQKLVRATRVDGRIFDEASLVQFTAEFAAEFDFDISIFSFITAFLEHGIIHFDGGTVKIALPYIESYLLAKELLGEPSEAVRYFSLSSASFDFPAFDIYAELGPADTIVRMIERALDECIASLPALNGNPHAIMTSRAAAAEGVAAVKYQKLVSQMHDAFDDVLAGDPASSQKQQILDIRNDVRSVAAKEVPARFSSHEQRDADMQLLNNCVGTWSAGLILINSAAEHLTGMTKRATAAKLIVLSSRILHFWTGICS